MLRRGDRQVVTDNPTGMFDPEGEGTTILRKCGIYQSTWRKIPVAYNIQNGMRRSPRI
jgi:hypothetical protein